MALPKHSHAAGFLKAGLFDGLDSFACLEERVSALPTPQERGMAFEVFAEGYFSTQRQSQARHVWPSNAVPPTVRKKLALPTPEIGYDGVIETLSAEYHAYQVKFRRSRALTYQEISTSLSISDLADQRVLFTNCTRLPERALKGRSRFFAIRGSDLNRLLKVDFDGIQKWLQSVEVSRKPKRPRPHQSAAIADLVAGLKDNDRATSLMACGTGKTLVGLWVAEQMEARNVLLLVPSLALLRQTLHEWVAETRWEDLAYLSVCSDPTVTRGVDQWVLRQSDLDFPVTTDSDTVRRFLSGRYHGTRLVFCTYQSAEVLAAGMPARFQFDIGVFDEAHKTAGRVGQKFGFALSDKNVRIKKRVFMTATPRHYHPLKKDAQGDHTLVYSMDNPKVYGPVVHELTFAEAAKKAIVCDYKVLISVATTEMVSEVLRNRGEVLIDGDLVKVRQVANQISIQQAVEKHGVSKIISFHNSIAAAKSFTSDLPEGIGTHLPDFESFHVNGSIPTASREALMSEFRDSDRGIVSNARCLTEGVDVPVVDMVAFMAPKRSRIDIVQAVGRAMRTAPDKEIGYVLVPLYLEVDKNEGIEEALERSDFTHVADVLNAIQTQDETLVDVIRAMRTERGRTGGFDDSWLRDYVEVLGPAITLPKLYEGIATWVVDQLGVTFDERFGELLAHREKHGDCLVPSKWPENQQLATWVLNTRNRRSKLTEDQIRKLDEIGFVWDVTALKFEQMYEALVAYKSDHGDCLVPARWSENPQLGRWADHLREGPGKLTEDQIRRLTEIGFVWGVAAFQFEQMYEELVAYKRERGDCLVPARWPENQQLATWVSGLRGRRSKLPEDQIRRLAEIGFVWDVPAFQFEQMYAALVAYKKDHGDCLVPFQWPENPQLASWVSVLRQKRSKLTEDRIRKLDEIGFVWDVPAFQFEQMYAALVAYKKDHGDCLVPYGWPENPQLSRWVAHLREGAIKLTEDRIRKLDEIGFVWRVRSD